MEKREGNIADGFVTKSDNVRPLCVLFQVVGKFLFNSLTGLIGDIAWQVSKEGHEVRYLSSTQATSMLQLNVLPN